jgi:hypothetical protein
MQNPGHDGDAQSRRPQSPEGRFQLVIDLGTQDQLRHVRRTAQDFDMTEVEKIMDHRVLNERVVEEWQKEAADRLTVVFCSTVQHAEHVCEAFRAAGVEAAVVWGEMPEAERRETLERFDRGEIRVIVNVMVLTEGWDCQPVSCIILLRPASFKSTMIQMIGRGLRKVDPERYPNVQKDNCVVLDFGTSILLHGSIEQDVFLDGGGVKICNNCQATIPKQCPECPICGFEFPVLVSAEEWKNCRACGVENPVGARICQSCGEPFGEAQEKAQLDNFRMTEVDLLQLSPYRWETMFEGLCWVACALDAWAVVIKYLGRWIALGARKGEPMRVLGNAEDAALALVSADDFLREQGDAQKAGKMNHWLSQPPSEKQLAFLGLTHMTAMGMSRYRAACCITWMMNERGIKQRLFDYREQQRIAA